MVELKDARVEISRNNTKVPMREQSSWSELVNCQLFQLEISTALNIKTVWSSIKAENKSI